MRYDEISYQTKRQIADALKRALQKKAFSKITVSELIADCGVNRKTFYYHFEDIYALLKWMLDEDAVELYKQYGNAMEYEDVLLFVIEYVDRNAYILNCLYDAVGRNGLIRFFYKDGITLIEALIDNAQKEVGLYLDEDYREFLGNYHAEALAGMLLAFIKDRSHRSKERLVAYITKTFDLSLTATIKQYGKPKAETAS